jgi:ferrochelatase
MAAHVTPAARRVKAIAGTVWILVGAMLLARSVPMFVSAIAQWGAFGSTLALLVGAWLGALKGKYVLSRAARRNRRRIEKMAAPRPWHVFSGITWLLIAGMIGLGLLIRAGAAAELYPWGPVAALYAGIGAAMGRSALAYFARTPPPLPTRSNEPPAAAERRRGVLVVNLGTPDAPTKPAVRRYLREFLGDPRVVEAPRWLWFFVLRCIVLPFRACRSAHAYQRVFTRQGSPLLVNSRAFTQALADELGPGFAVALAMRYGNPGIAAGLDELRRAGCEEVTVVPLFPQWSNTTTGTVQLEVARVAAQRRDPPALQFLGPLYVDPGYVAALGARVRDAAAGRAVDFHVFSFHGLPEAYVRGGDPYLRHCTATSFALASALGLQRSQWEMVFQSRFGDEPWLQPYADEFVNALAKTHRRVLIALPAFAADCLETIEEIGMTMVESFKQAGGQELVVVPALNSHPLWVAAVAARVRELAGAATDEVART